MDLEETLEIILAKLEGMDSIEAKLDSLDLRFEMTETWFDSLEAKLEVMESRFDSLEARFDSVDAKTESLETGIESLGVGMGALETGLDSVNTRMGALESGLDAANARLESLEAQLGSANGAEAVKAELDAIDGRIEQLSGGIRDIRLTLEHETNKNILQIAEGNLDLGRRLDDSLKLENEKEMLIIRVNTLENELRRLKEQLKHAD